VINIVVNVYQPTFTGFKKKPSNLYVDKVIEYPYFLSGRYERFEYELSKFADGKYISDGLIDVKEASINVDFTRNIIATASITIKKNTEFNYHSDMIRIYYVLNDLYRYPLGTFHLSVPENASNNTTFIPSTIECFDKLIVLEQDKLEYTYVAEAGEKVTDLVINLIGDLQNEIIASDAVLTENLIYEAGKSKLSIINSLLKMINYQQIFADGLGTLRAIPWQAEYNIVWDFFDDENGLYMPAFNHKQDYSDIYNKVVVYTNNTTEDEEPLTAVKTLEDAGLDYLPFSYTNIGRYITKIFDSEAVEQSYLTERALRELKKMAELQETINYKHAFAVKRLDGMLYPGDCYKFRNNLNSLYADYLIESYTWTLKAGQMVNTKLKGIIKNV